MKRKCKIVFFLYLLLSQNLIITFEASARKYVPFDYVRKDEIFSNYSKYVSEVFDISWKKPKGFVDLKKSETWALKQRHVISFFYQLTLRSTGKDCYIMYPNLGLVAPILDRPETVKYGKSDLVRKLIMAEVGDSLIEERLTVFVGSEVPMNADTVFVFRTTLERPYKGHSYCTSVYAYKEGRPPMIFRCFFTEKGKAKEEKYLARLYKSACYRPNDGWTTDSQRMSEAYRELFEY